MTPDELRALADEATRHDEEGDFVWDRADDLARLCAELGEALEWQLRWLPKDVRGAPANVDAFAVLAKLAELDNGAEQSPTAERT